MRRWMPWIGVDQLTRRRPSNFARHSRNQAFTLDRARNENPAKALSMAAFTLTLLVVAALSWMWFVSSSRKLTGRIHHAWGNGLSKTFDPSDWRATSEIRCVEKALFQRRQLSKARSAIMEWSWSSDEGYSYCNACQERGGGSLRHV